ncbi:hypothetical protein, partial [Pyrobaculum sp.]|uniref:hypothetical protein n=1 Tax=Pyrobaculum sp. TaxID=2004705 RepID=UPI003D1303D0
DNKLYYLCKLPPYILFDTKIVVFPNLLSFFIESNDKKLANELNNPLIREQLISQSILNDKLENCEQIDLIILRLTDVTGIDDLVSKLLELRSARSFIMPVATGYNVYFSAGKVYPVIRITAPGEKNPYYFVVPFAAPAREFFVLGKVGDVVVFDGGRPW